jgi:endonuclease YncB( thermonuclease family)
MLLAGKFVTVNYQSMTPQGEINGTVLHGGSDINLRMLETGLVRITGQAVPPEIPQSYRTAERRAQERHLGMWKQAQH